MEKVLWGKGRAGIYDTKVLSRETDPGFWIAIGVWCRTGRRGLVRGGMQWIPACLTG
ncbi:MAG: hypothetical protein OEX02_12060 [Cyclobacteriaceae bacterium]|nr:hypothetical protein [Cyclobacteriaceae bacterium]